MVSMVHDFQLQLKPIFTASLHQEACGVFGCLGIPLSAHRNVSMLTAFSILSIHILHWSVHALLMSWRQVHKPVVFNALRRGEAA